MLKKWLFLSLGELFSLPLPAQIALDGTLSPQLTLPGPHYQIGAELGQQRGNNLFHSFKDFNLTAGESATFSGPASINNIISRVTGGQASHLDGLLRSTIPNADVYLINPAGISFGSQATLDISGSFHASSADVLRFEDGGTFNARQPDQSVLSIAPVAAFGFLTDSPGALTVEGSHLSVPEQQSFSLLGGEITLNQAQIQAPFGQLNLASVAEIGLEPTALKLTGSRGNISIRDSQIHLSGEGGGALDLQGGQIVMIGSEIDATTQGAAAGRGVKIKADQLMIEGGYLFSDTAGSGSGGDIEIEAGSVNLEAGAALTADILGSGDGGKVKIDSQQITLATGGRISANTSGTGNAGKITLTATDTLRITGTTNDIQYSSEISASVNSGASGAGGEVQIAAKQITLEGGGRIDVGTFGTGNAGRLTLTVTDTLLITGTMTDNQYHYSGVIAQVGLNATGAGGDLQIAAKQITLEGGGQISVNTFGAGNAGKITLTAADVLLITGEDSSITALGANGAGGDVQIAAKQITLETGGRISSGTFGEGHAGRITLIVADKLLITRNSFVESIVMPSATGTGGEVQIEAKQVMLEAGGKIFIGTLGQGQGGKLILIATDKLLIAGEDSLVAAPGAGGDGGDVQIEAKQIALEAGGIISVGSFGEGHAGKLTLIAPDKLLITEDSLVDTSVGLNAGGAGGDLQIEAKQVILATGGKITVGTSGQGHGGDLTLTVTDLLITGENSLIEAAVWANATGAGGDIQIEAKQVALTAGGQIFTGTLGQGQGGNLTLIATDKLLVTGKSSNGKSSLVGASVQPDATGTGGEVRINARQVLLATGGKLSVETLGPGKGGNLNLNTDSLLITQGGIISAESRNNGGTAGEIIIKANDNIRLQNQNSRISTATNGADGGNITLTTAGLLYLTDQSQISTSVQAQQGNGGNITLQPLFLILDDSKILAQAIEGRGGDINIKTNDIYVFPSAQFPQAANQERLKQAISASSQLGVSGTLTVNSPEINIGKNLIVFATTMTDASSKLKQCVAKALSERSHFYIKRLPTRRLVLDDLRASRLLLASTAPSSAQTTNTQSAQSPPQVALLIGCRQEPNQESSMDADPTQLF